MIRNAVRNPITVIPAAREFLHRRRLHACEGRRRRHERAGGIEPSRSRREDAPDEVRILRQSALVRFQGGKPLLHGLQPGFQHVLGNGANVQPGVPQRLHRHARDVLIRQNGGHAAPRSGVEGFVLERVRGVGEDGPERFRRSRVTTVKLPSS